MRDENAAPVDAPVPEGVNRLEQANALTLGGAADRVATVIRANSAMRRLGLSDGAIGAALTGSGRKLIVVSPRLSLVVAR
jgi:hypothetical protein